MNYIQPPWERGEKRKTPCCSADAKLSGQRVPSVIDGSVWTCDACGKEWKWCELKLVTED